MEQNVDKLSKSFSFAEFEFKVAINRAISFETLKKFPKFLEAIINNNTAMQFAANKKQKISAQAAIDYYELELLYEEYTPKIVKDAFAHMLEHANSCLPKNYDDYEEYANAVLKAAEKYEILYDYLAENEKGEEVSCAGLYTELMELVSLGFTQGRPQKKGKVIMKKNI